MRARSKAAVPAILVLLFVCSAFPAAVIGAPPIADAGPDATVVEGTYYLFDASGSTDDEGIVNYTWTFDYWGVDRNLYGITNDTFRFALPGTYNVTLTVRDDEGGTAEDMMTLIVVAEKVNYLEEYWWAFVIGGAVAAIVALILLILYSNLKIVPETTKEKTRLLMGRLMDITKQILHHKMGAVGVVIITFFVLLAIFGPFLTPYSVDTVTGDRFKPYLKPSDEHWMGTDSRGYDIFSQLLYGARTSIIVGIFAAIIASILGASIGLYSGFVGGWKDEAIMRVNDVILSIPWLVLMILVAAMIGEITLTLLIVIIGITGWSGTARLVRAQVLSLRERMYVERARAIGSSDIHIIGKHILPNAFPLVFANTILTVAISILSEATLSFLRMRPRGTTTWGTMLSYAQEATALQIGLWEWIIMPGLCIVFLVLGFTLLGHALDEITNPRLRRR
jgi:peptide/nickel transport system permease protein